MTALETRGGFPFVRRLAIPTGDAPIQIVKSPGHIKYLQISNEGAGNVRVYFSRRDYEENENYIVLPATNGSFEGPVELREQYLFLRSETGTSDPVVVTFYLRR